MINEFFIGFLHPKRVNRQSKAMSNPAEKNAGRNEQSRLPQTPGPLYKELQPESTLEHEDLVELKENVAYRPIAK